MTAWIDARIEWFGVCIGAALADRIADRMQLDDLNATFGSWLVGLNTAWKERY
jgi:hypothetical protein